MTREDIDAFRRRMNSAQTLEQVIAGMRQLLERPFQETLEVCWPSALKAAKRLSNTEGPQQQ